MNSIHMYADKLRTFEVVSGHVLVLERPLICAHTLSRVPNVLLADAYIVVR